MRPWISIWGVVRPSVTSSVTSSFFYAYRSARIIRCGGAKIDGTPPTAQTPGPNWLNFFVEAPQEDTFRGIGGIFEFRLRSWNIGAFVLILEPFGGSKNTLKWATKSSLSWLLGWNSKIPPMPLKVSSWGASAKNLSEIRPRGLSCREGCHRFWPLHIL